MKAFITLILLIYVVSLSSNLVLNRPFEHTQPDGKVLSLFVSGDEYYHRVHDENGYTILLHPETGYAVYAVPDGKSIKASDYEVGVVNPVTVGIIPNLYKNDESIEQSRREQQANRDAGNRGSPVGTINNIVGLVRFNNQTSFPSTPNFNHYNNLYNSMTQQSLKDYYDEVSNGQLTINSYLYPGYSIGGAPLCMQVSHNRSYYLPYSSSNTTGYSTSDEKTIRHHDLIVELLGLIDNYIPAGLDLDNDNDGIIDGLTFVFRGDDGDVWGELLWPKHVTWVEPLGTLNGASVTHYVFAFETGLQDTLSGVSVMSHEMGHMIGFPDFYHYPNDYLSPVGQWDLMSLDHAQHSLTYNKWKYGTWFSSIPTLTATTVPTTYTLTAIDQSPYSCYKIASNYATQHYVVEYRRKTGRYESGIPNTGLIVYRIILDFAGHEIIGNAQGPPDEVYLYRPGGDINSSGTLYHANFSATAGRTVIYTGADPEPWLFTNASGQADGNLVITDIGYSGDTTISFILRDSKPNIWTGATSANWNTASNWSLNAVPTSSQDVEIPSLLIRYPQVTTTQSCRNILLKSGASLTVGAGSLEVTKNFESYGTLTLNSTGSVFTVQGKCNLNNGSTTNMTVNANIYVQGNLDFYEGSTANITNGNIRLYGTGNSYIRTYTPTSIYNLRMNKTDGGLCGIGTVSTASLTIEGSIYVTTGTMTHGYNGTTILKGSLFVNSGALCTLNSGTLRLEGNSSASFSCIDAGNYLNNLYINKDNSATVSLSYSLSVQGSTTVNAGILNLNHKTLTNAGNIAVNSIMKLDNAANLFITNTKTLYVNNGGYLEIIGTESQPATISHNSSGYYNLNVESGGRLAARYAVFEYMNTNGVYIKTGATIDSLNYCTFHNGTSGGRLLRIDNNQSITIKGATFPANTWSGVYNISKTVNEGIVYFIGWSGDFGGSSFEHDNYNHIFWQGQSIPPITDLDFSYISMSNRVELNWSYPYPVTEYMIYRKSTPTSAFNFHASTTSNSWSEAVPGTQRFYRVTAVGP